MASVMSAARTLGEISGWSLSNLTMQKTLYIAQMFQLGRGLPPLFPEHFEAWDYGPVVPKLYHKLKMFGAKPVQDIFYERELPASAPEMQALLDAYGTTKSFSGGKLVAITHWEGGAWARRYEPHKRGRVILNSEIAQEFHDRLEREAVPA